MTPRPDPGDNLPMNKTATVFLDFDGVLHRFFPVQGESDESNAHFAFLPAFEMAIRACPRPVEIIIASTWRHKYSLTELKSHFSEDIAAHIVGVTPRIEGGNGPGGRLREVHAWLAANGRPMADWVGVDDFPTLYGQGAVVACQDGFFDREHELLVQAVADPGAFAAANPCSVQDNDRALKLVVGVGTRPD